MIQNKQKQQLLRWRKQMTRRIQPRIKDIIREPSNSSLHPELKKKVLQDAKAFNVSPSWVVATAIAHFYSFKQQPRFDEIAKAYIRRVK